MNNAAKFASLLALSAVILPCLLFYTGALTLDSVKWIALAGSIGWFIATPLWMGRELPIDSKQVEI